MAKKTAKRKSKKSKTKAVRRSPRRAKTASVSASKKGGSAGKLPTKGGRPQFKPTDEHRHQVETLSGLGLKLEEIALLIVNPQTDQPISVNTLRRHFAEELARGKPKMDAQVAQSLVRRAVDMNHPQGATCAIFYLKTRAGWRETLGIEANIKSGVLVAPAEQDPEDWIAAAARRTADAPEPGAEE
jgi:hypothetical protein